MLWFARLGMIAGLLAFSTAGWSVPPEHWWESGYAYNARNTPVGKLLQDFSDSFGVTLESSGEIPGTVDGWLRASNAVEFLDRISVKYKLQWFVYNKVLYVSPISDNVIQRIEISQDGASDLKRALQGVGLLEEKFGWGEITDEGAILISGPKKYIQLVRSLVKIKKKTSKSREEVMVFPLKHAAVEDREIVIREQTTTIPGVASVLRNLLEKKRSRSDSSLLGSSGQSLETLRTMAESAEDRIDKSPWQKQGSGDGLDTSRRRGNNVRVEADVRTNSVLIYDATNKRSYYERLIKILDVPQKLIEIEAIIVDIDRNRLKDLGVDWQAMSKGRSVAMNVSGIGQDPAGQFANGSATMLISDIGHFYASLRALEGEGEASVIANPSVLTLENQPAVIDLSQTSYIQTVGERVANVVPVTAGTMLRVIPRQVRGDGDTKIQLIVDIEDGRIIQTSTDQLPTVQRNSIATKAVIDENYSLVVGGYHIQQNSEQVSKLPLVGDLPVVGKLFTSTSKSQSQRERLFILTPHVSGSRHNVASYVDREYRAKVDGAVLKVRQRHKEASASVMDRVRTLFTALAREELPSGYSVTGNTPHSSCGFKNARFDFSHGRTISGSGLEVHVGVVENTGRATLEIPESVCDDQGVIAVSFWPGSALAPGQKGEVFIARYPEMRRSTKLPSLIGRP